MLEKFRVRLHNEQLTFNAAHFITYDGNTCEQLHGHNFRVSVDVEGPLDENHYVVDFIALRNDLKQITATLDHGVLLPTMHSAMRVRETEREVEVTFGDRRWVFPREDCRLLPVHNTTAELIARHIAVQLLHNLQQRLGRSPTLLRVAVEEETSQWGICELHRGPTDG
ncbi:MAG: 6-pyruvoyl tetrahydropterin synthase family protein [Planctomycetes bacterium]|nr:6-pyruvoyl tetrahydropterin synthase family protein [Planctomycetota bacterium]